MGISKHYLRKFVTVYYAFRLCFYFITETNSFFIHVIRLTRLPIVTQTKQKVTFENICAKTCRATLEIFPKSDKSGQKRSFDWEILKPLL